MIEKFLEKANKPCVFFSGGMDSLLVLAKVREIKPDVPVVTFRQDMPEHQWQLIERVIRQWDLQVLSWPASNAYLIPNRDDISLVTEYNLNGINLPVVRDIIPGDKCSFELDPKRLPVMPLDHDVVFVGTRSEDSHSVMGRPLQKPVTTIGSFTFVAPLFNMSKDEVIRESMDRDLPYSVEWYVDKNEEYDTGNLPLCSNCLQEGSGYVYCPKRVAYIPRVEWDRAGMLNAFQKKFGFEVNNAN